MARGSLLLIRETHVYMSPGNGRILDRHTLKGATARIAEATEIKAASSLY